MITCECFVGTAATGKPLEAVGAIESEIGRKVETEGVSGEKASATGEKRKGEYCVLRAASESERRTGARNEGKFMHCRKERIGNNNFFDPQLLVISPSLAPPSPRLATSHRWNHSAECRRDDYEIPVSNLSADSNRATGQN